MTEATTRHVTSLKSILTANAVFSALCAVVFLAAAGAVADLVGTPKSDIVTTGVSLIVFVGMIVIVLTRLATLSRWVLALTIAIAGLDVLWVLTTPLKVLTYATTGKWLFGIIALVVAFFALFQIRALAGIFRGPQRERTLGATR